jgi:predicted secreted protein
LSEPSNVYQLSLRLGTSYEAMASALLKYGTFDRSTFNQVVATQPKRIKRSLLGAYEIDDWHPNVWLLTERDEGTVIHGEPNDIFIVRLKENSSAGYLWNLDELKREGFVVVNDERRIPPADEGIGGAVDRVLTARSQAPLLGEINAVHARPWDPADTIAYFSFTYDLRGKESGMSRVERERPVAA